MKKIRKKPVSYEVLGQTEYEVRAQALHKLDGNTSCKVLLHKGLDESSGKVWILVRNRVWDLVGNFT
jgi:hypothetical protein